MAEAALRENGPAHRQDERRTGVIARKMGMTRIFDEQGNMVPVTILCLSGCRVVGHMTEERNGYTALQLGAGDIKVANLTRAERGIFAAAKVLPAREVVEFRVPNKHLLPIGSVITADHFVVGQYVDVRGTTVGKGFAGGMKRHGFGGLRATHGVSISHRSIGSTGGRQDPGKTFKNKKMPGQMGNEKATIQNLEVVGTDVAREVIYVRGAVPGRDGWVNVRDAVKKPRPKAAPLPGAFQTPDVNTESVESLPERGKPVALTENLGKMDPAGELERGLMQAFVDLEEADPAGRLAAIGIMLAKAFAARRAKAPDRSVRKRVRAMQKAFVDALFDDEKSVRWAAAYAIAALEDPKHQLEGDKIPPSDQVGEKREKYIRDVLEHYFQAREVELLTSLSLDVVNQTTDETRLKLVARVSRELPVTLAGRAALTGTKESLKSGSKLTVTVTDTSGTVNAIIENTAGDADTTVRAETQVSVPTGNDEEIFVDFDIDGRALNTLSVPVRLILEREGHSTKLTTVR